MATYSSSSATGAGSMRAVLMLMLLLGAVVAAHGHQVSCENKCNQPVTVNGVVIAVDAIVNIEVLLEVTVEVVDKVGVILSGVYPCPSDVTALVVVFESGCIQVKVKAVLGLLGGVISTVVGAVLGLFQCNCY